MNWTAKYQPQRDQYWPDVEQYFGNLPSHLFRHGVLLKNNLATFFSNTGQFKDILCRDHDLPLLYLHFWLLDDFRFPDTSERVKLEKYLFLAMTFTFAAVYTHETIFDEDTNFGRHYLFLERALTQQADFYLARLYPGPSSFWRYYQTFWFEYAEVALWEETADANEATVLSDAELAQIAGKLAFTKIPVVAVAISAGREASMRQLCAMMDQLNFIFQMRRDISTLRRDIMRRNYTYPIIKTMREAGLNPHQPISSEQLLGALVLTGVVEKIGRECLSRLDECRAISERLDLSTFTAYLALVESLVGEMMELFSMKTKPKTANTKPAPARQKQRQPFFVPYVDTLPKVIEMAEGYLLSDLTFRESWEVQRRGIFGVPEVTSKAFPIGMIVEQLCKHGHDMTEPINMVFETLQATGFRYYDDPHLPPDTDDLGLLLRLYPYSAQPKAHHDILKTPLRWLANNIQEAGEIPVWLTQNDVYSKAEQQFTSLWGRRCAAVEANVLLGLIDYDWKKYRQIIEKSAQNLFERLTTDGLSATLHYVPLYSLWATFELIIRLSTKPLSKVLQNTLDLATQTLLKRLAVEIKRPSLTPQAGAFLTAICLRPGDSDLTRSTQTLFRPDWITLLGKTQRYDGSWADEPLYCAPTRGELATWYASRSVTTAFCYHALKTYKAMK